MACPRPIPEAPCSTCSCSVPLNPLVPSVVIPEGLAIINDHHCVSDARHALVTTNPAYAMSAGLYMDDDLFLIHYSYGSA
uniref:Uncharacterized protein n=1 Tax=Anguilla anguilla TaxID=7936 RepID=A0A0E9Q1K9_ANGAN